MRHSCASLLLAEGAQIKEIQNWLGHASYKLTADTYSHLEFSSKLGMASKIENALNGDLKSKKELETKIGDLIKRIKQMGYASINDYLKDLESIKNEPINNEEDDESEGDIKMCM